MRIPIKKTSAPATKPDEVEAALAAIAAAAADAGNIAPKVRAATAQLGRARGLILATARAFDIRVRRHMAGPSGEIAAQAAIELVQEAAAHAGDAKGAQQVLARTPGEMQRLATNAIRDKLIDDKARERAETIATQTVDAIRAVKIAIESERDRFLGPPSMNGTSAREVENNYDREEDVREMGVAAAFAQWKRYVERGEEENAHRWGAALYSVARSIANGPVAEAVRGRTPTRTGDIDKTRNDAFDVLAAMKRHRATQAPPSLGVAATLYAELVAAFRLLVGEHACWMSAAQFGSTMGLASSDELEIDKEWPTRWLRPEPLARGVRPPFAPSWTPTSLVSAMRG